MLTTKDWIARARGDSVAESLANAERVARFADDLVAVAEAWRAIGDDNEARRCAAAAITRASGDHWPTVAAARVYLTIGDRDAAVVALATIERYLHAPHTRIYRWVLLARAWRDVDHDDAAARRCVEAAAATASSASDLTELVDGLLLIAEPERARAAIDRAEALALRDAQDAIWGVAIAWKHALGEPDRAHALLTTATEEATEASVLVRLASAWASLFPEAPGLRRALARAETLATSSADWLSIAEAYFDGGNDARREAWDAAGVHRALDAAVAAGPVPDQTAAIAAGFRDWLGLAGEELGLPPALVAPEERAPVRHRLDGWRGGDPRALLHRLRARISDAQLAALAQADYGMAWRKHLRVLGAIRSTGLVPIPLDWYPREVCELARWVSGERVDHIERAFAATVLALEAGTPQTHGASHLNTMLAPLVESGWQLDLDAELETFLAWLGEVASDEERAWALLALVLTRARREPADPRLEALVAELIEAEAVACKGTQPDGGWLFGTTTFDKCFDLWRELAAAVLGRATAPYLCELGRLLGVLPT